jgi:hypothetical protein
VTIGDGDRALTIAAISSVTGGFASAPPATPSAISVLAIRRVGRKFLSTGSRNTQSALTCSQPSRQPDAILMHSP